jgi:hypothetical protein
MQENDYNQALKLQKQNFGFEKQYFKTFLEMVNEMKDKNET